MWYSQFSIGSTSSSDSHRIYLGRKLAVICCCFLLILLLAACGSSAAASSQLTPTPTPTLMPTPTDTPTPSPTPSPSPTPKPTPTPTPKPAPLPTQPPAPTQPPPAPAPAPILDVAPASMSIVGHFDCSRTTTVFVCQAAVISRANNQAILHWVAFANFGNVGFAPSVGNLAPGTRIILTIRIPVTECAGTFFFQGPVNTHTISWQC